MIGAAEAGNNAAIVGDCPELGVARIGSNVPGR
jgi:hypothetical protein